MDCFALLAMTAHKSTKETVKTTACGNVGRFRCTRLLVCVLPIQSAREAAGATGTRRSPRPLWAKASSTDSGALRGEGEVVCGFFVIASAAKQSILSLRGAMDCF